MTRMQDSAVLKERLGSDRGLTKEEVSIIDISIHFI
jgi:hypothetical protein